MTSKYNSAVVQLQDGRELYLRSVEWGTALRGRCSDTNQEVVIKSSNIALLIPDVSVNEYNEYLDDNLELVVSTRWDQ